MDISERETRHPLIRRVESYLRACEAGRFDEARRYLADGFVMVFPGGSRYTDPAARAEDAKTQYTWVRKAFLGWSIGETLDGRASVVSWGTLEGEDLAGNPFSGVRYVDLFFFEGDLIEEQLVYNDLVVMGVVKPARTDQA